MDQRQARTDAEVDDTNLLANRAALARAGIGLTLPENTRPDGEIEVVDGRIRGVFLHTAGGRFRMHGAHDPLAEAAALLPRPLAAPLVVVVGAGAGYLLDVLEQEAYTGRVLLLEPSVSSLLATLRRRDLSGSIDAGVLRLLPGPRYEAWPELTAWVGDLPSPPAVIIHPVLARQRPGDVREALDVVKRLLFGARANEAARRAFAGPYLRHTLANLAHLEASRDVGVLQGVPSGRGGTDYW